MIDNQLRENIAAIVEDCGYVLWYCDYLPQGKHSVFRVYIDHPQGIGLDACEKVSRQISAFLDVDDPISGAYSLEVSSPGWPRPLFTAAHYQQYQGKEVEIKTMKPIDKKRKFIGIIEAIEDNETLLLRDRDRVQSIALSNIVKAQLTD